MPKKVVKKKVAKKNQVKKLGNAKKAVKKVIKKVVKKKGGIKSVPKTADLKEEREVVYDEPSTELCIGDNAITVAKAKELLGFEEEEGKTKFGHDHVREISSLFGCKVRAYNNIANRPLSIPNIKNLIQEILRRRWKFNGEPIIIGRTGIVENGQHQLFSLILAVKEWEEHPEKYSDWGVEPVIDKTIVYGVDEDDTTINTMDTCKPRSLTDVICRSELFRDMVPRDRLACSKMCDYAVKFLWSRTGMSTGAFSVRRTHAEALAFIDRHSRILDCVKHIHTENAGKDGKLSMFLSPGYMAGLLYLMSSGKSDAKAYYEAADGGEDLLDFSLSEEASDFFTNIAGCEKKVCALREAAKKMSADGNPTKDEQIALLVNAWNALLAGDEITEKTLALDYEVKDGVRHLIDCPTVGGIDLGDTKRTDEENIPAPDPTPKEIAKAKKKLKKEGKVTIKVNLKAPSRAGEEWAAGDVAWVQDDDGDTYLAKLTEDPWDCDDGFQRVMVQAETGDWEVKVDQLSMDEPAPKETKPLPSMKKFPKNKPTKHVKFNPAKVKEGGLFWVKAEEPWRGKVVELSKNAVKLKVENGFQGAGSVRVVQMTELSNTQPNVILPDEEAA